MKDIKLIIDGKTIQLTEEQIKSLNLIKPDSPFNRVKDGEEYWNINSTGKICHDIEAYSPYDNEVFNSANYCTDKELLLQQAYRETLNRLLWRFSMENGGGEIDEFQQKWFIFYNYSEDRFIYSSYTNLHIVNTVAFIDKEIAKRAIEEIVEPFMAEHPDFVI